MKRHIIPVLLACAASLALAQAQTDSPTTPPSPAASPSLSGSSGGPGPGGHHGHHGERLERLAKALNLTPDQKQQVAAVLKANKPQFEALQQQRKALMTTVAGQINPILTPEQQQKFAQIQQRLENGGGPGKFGGGPGHPGFGGPGHGGPNGPGQGDVLQKMTANLGLTQDQQNQIKPILDAAHTQMQSIRANTTLTPEQKMAQVKDTWQGAQGQINGILTAEQQQKLAALRASEKGHWHRHGGQPGSSPAPSPVTTGTAGATST